MQNLDKPQSIGDHINALRGCILRSILFLAVFFLAVFFVFASDLIQLVLAPLRSYSFVLGRIPDVGNLIVINILDKFIVTVLVSVLSAFFLSVPYWFFEFWNFLKPALTSNEKHVFIRFFPFVMFFFALGALFGYFFVIPVSIDFLSNFGDDSFALAGVETSLTLMSYLRYFFIMTFFLGLIFELPLILMLIVRVTDLEPRFFAKFRKHFIVLSFIIAMLLTPPDVITQLMLAVPMVAMYEIGIILARIAQHRKAQRFDNNFVELEDDFEKPADSEIEKPKTETAQPDVITGFTQNNTTPKKVDDFENKKLSKPENFDKISSEISEKSNQIKQKPADVHAKVDSQVSSSDSVLSALTEDQIKAVKYLIEQYIEKNKGSN